MWARSMSTSPPLTLKSRYVPPHKTELMNWAVPRKFDVLKTATVARARSP